jgi:hypothetical protein
MTSSGNVTNILNWLFHNSCSIWGWRLNKQDYLEDLDVKLRRNLLTNPLTQELVASDKGLCSMEYPHVEGNVAGIFFMHYLLEEWRILSSGMCSRVWTFRLLSPKDIYNKTFSAVHILPRSAAPNIMFFAVHIPPPPPS